MERIILDTSAIYALLDKSDDNHQKAKKLFINLSKENFNILISNFILAECHAIISGRLGHELARKWLQNQCWPVERITEEDEKRAQEIIFTFTDKSFSYTDATTFAIMERLGITKVFAFDQHFAQFGFTFYNENLH